MTDSDRAAPPYGQVYHPSTRPVPANGLGAALLPPAVPSRMPRQRRPAMIALAIALIGAGILGSLAVYSHLNRERSVLVVAASVAAGGTISSSDLTSANVAYSAGIQAIPSRQLGQVAGLIAATALRPGMLLAPSEVTTTLPPAPGQELVAIAVHPSALPASGLAPGDQVLLTPTPGIPGAAGTTNAGTAILKSPVAATVEAAAVAPDQDGLDVVDVLVPAAQGTAVADQASTGQIAIIVTHRAPR